MSNCKDCGKEISPKAKRCGLCAGNTRKAPVDYHALAKKRGFRWVGPEVFNKNAKTGWECEKGHRWEAPYGNVRGGSGCPSCANERRFKSMKERWEYGDFDDIFDSPEYHRKLSDAMRARWQDPEYRRKHSEAQKIAQNRPEVKAKKTEALKVSHARGDRAGIQNRPIVRAKKSEGMKTAWERGDFDGCHDNPEARRKHSEAMEARWANGDMDGVFQSPTAIELMMAAALDICGIEHVSQYRPDGYGRIYDEFVLPNVLIEVNGDYWHGPERPENQERDIEKATWADENGYYLVVIWEHEIEEQGAWSLVHERILSLLEAI